jgi:hypothetical protein
MINRSVFAVFSRIPMGCPGRAPRGRPEKLGRNPIRQRDVAANRVREAR